MLWEYIFVGGIGLALGSFANVVALRYGGDAFLFSSRVLGGRSHCPHCKKTLGWSELIPVFSFLILRGKCRSCGARIGWQYPAVEAISAILFVGSLQLFYRLQILPGHEFPSALFWGFILWLFLVLSLVDIRLRIIPDEIHVLILATGLVWVFAGQYYVSFFSGSFLGASALAFGRWGTLTNHLLGILVGALFFFLLFILTRGRAMGMGDVKFAAALGFLFGWPDVLAIMILAFVFGGIFGAAMLLSRTYTMKSAVPFGPFLAVAAAMVFFFGEPLARWYFTTLPGLLFG